MPYRLARSVIILLVTCLAPPLRGFAQETRAAARPPTPDARQVIRLQEHAPRGGANALARQVASLTAPRPVDVQRYTIDLKVIPATTRIEGTVRLQALVETAGLSALDVGLYDVLAVTSIRKGVTALGFTRGSNLLHITLDRPYALGELLDFSIDWSGTPPAAGYGAFTFRTHGATAQPIISSLSEDIYAPVWWPCIDDPTDKAIVDMNLNVPDTLIGVSNGLLTATIVVGDGTRTFQWRSAYPISTYLVSVAISNYSTITDSYPPVTGGPPMPVEHYVYPEKLAAAPVSYTH